MLQFDELAAVSDMEQAMVLSWDLVRGILESLVSGSQLLLARHRVTAASGWNTWRQAETAPTFSSQAKKSKSLIVTRVDSG